MTGRLGGRLIGRFIGLGVTGSIAAYKAVELLRLLRAEGADVAVMLTPAASQFVGPLSFAALSRHPVETDLLGLLPDGRIGHIVVGDAADAIVVAPATAHFLAAMAIGLAGDVVTATCLATPGAGHRRAGDGRRHVDPPGDRRPTSPGCATTSATRSSSPSRGRWLRVSLAWDGWPSCRASWTPSSPPSRIDPSGPPIPPPVRRSCRRPATPTSPADTSWSPRAAPARRSIRSASSAIARPARWASRSPRRPSRAARVTIIAANVEVPLPGTATVIRVDSTADLRSALLRVTHEADGSAGFDALVMAAAVADFRPVAPADRKLERGSPRLAIELESTPDLLAEIGRIAHGLDSDGAPTRAPLRPVPILVGFAAETGSLERADEKLRRKGVDLLVANDVTEPGSGFGTDTNRVTILGADGSRDELPILSKREVAERLLDRLAPALDERDAARQTDVTTEPSREPA